MTTANYELPITFIPTGKTKLLQFTGPLTFEEFECHLFQLFDLENKDRLVIETEINPNEYCSIVSDEDVITLLTSVISGDERICRFTTDGVRASQEANDSKVPFAVFFKKDPERGIILKEQLNSWKIDFMGLFKRNKPTEEELTPAEETPEDLPSKDAKDKQ